MVIFCWMMKYLRNMAGIQLCCRKSLVFNTSRFFSKKELLLQQSRKRHHLVFHVSSQSRLVFQKSNLVSYTGRLFTYRLSSTSVIEPKNLAVNPSSTKVPEAANESAVLNNEANSTDHFNVVIDESTLPPIPSKVSEVPDLEFVSTGLKEPSFESLGLGSWWPTGIIQKILEYLHINLDLPWWGAIAVVTVLSRLLIFPLHLNSRRELVYLMNHRPQLTKLQEKINDAKLRGDYYAAAVCAQDFQKYIKDNNVNLFPVLKPMLLQTPIFLSIYWAFRDMAKLPVESMKTGGLFWFEDLTVPDPYYILPLVLSCSLFIMLETGAEGNPSKMNTLTIKCIMRGIPVILLIVSTKFATCMTWYWTVSNMLALCQLGLFKLPAVKKYFNIPEIQHFEMKPPASKTGFINEFKEGLSIAKIKSQIEDLERINSTAFQKAGTGPIPRTFKNNPLLKKAKDEL